MHSHDTLTSGYAQSHDARLLTPPAQYFRAEINPPIAPAALTVASEARTVLPYRFVASSSRAATLTASPRTVNSMRDSFARRQAGGSADWA